MTATVCQTLSGDLDWGLLVAAWNPADHPRDRRGRFTKSRTTSITEAERAIVNSTLAGFAPKKFSSGQEAMDYLTDGQPRLTPELADAVDYYSGDAFLDINRKLRSGAGADDDSTVKNLRAAMNPTSDDLLLTRTVGLEAFGKVPVEDLVGRKVKDAGFSSTALGVAYGGSLGNVKMKIVVPKGTPAIFAAPYSRNPTEREVILPDGLELVVASSKKNDTYGYDMVLVVLPTKDAPAVDKPNETAPGAAPVAPSQPADSVEALLAKLIGQPAPAFRNAPPLETPPEGWLARDEETVDAVDLAPVQAAWAAALAALVETWNTNVVSQWITALIDAIKTALSGDGDRADLGALTLDIADATTLLADAMAAMGETAAGHAVDEAAASDVDLTATWPTADDLEAAAREIAEFEARRYALTAGREAARVAGPEPDEDVVAEHMRTFLDELSDAPTEAALGSALTDAQNQARAKTLSTGPVGALYASEQMDSATCAPCKEIHGRWIANTDDQAALYKLYPTGGYIDCLGRWRCRGTVVGVWRPKTTEGGQ